MRITTEMMRTMTILLTKATIMQRMPRQSQKRTTPTMTTRLTKTIMMSTTMAM